MPMIKRCTSSEYISKILPLNEFNFRFVKQDENIFSQNFNIFSINDLVKIMKMFIFGLETINSKI